MLTANSINADQQLSVALAIYFARLALPVWQQKYPEDSRPEKAMKAAERAMFINAADTDADADASVAAYAAAADAAYAYANANAAYAAARAARAADAAGASIAAANAADAAANAAAALGKDRDSFIHHHLTQLLPLILWHKPIQSEALQSRKKVFELLPEDCREDFLFNLDLLR